MSQTEQHTTPADDVLDHYEELPERPLGWTQKMQVHLNYGSAGGAAVYAVFDPEGRQAPFVRSYDTRKEYRHAGFALDGEIYSSWRELRAKWPEIRAELIARREKANDKRN